MYRPRGPAGLCIGCHRGQPERLVEFAAANTPGFAVTTEQRNYRIRRRSQLSLKNEGT